MIKTRYWYLGGHKTGTIKRDNNRILHRIGGPACEYDDGDKFWYINGKMHREDGPAVEYADGVKYWYLNNEMIECETNEEFLRIVKLKAFL